MSEISREWSDVIDDLNLADDNASQRAALLKFAQRCAVLEQRIQALEDWVIVEAAKKPTW